MMRTVRARDGAYWHVVEGVSADHLRTRCGRTILIARSVEYAPVPHEVTLP